MTRVVVADDQDLVRAEFRLILERNGVEVVGEARDGVEAVAVVEDTRPDVLLKDVPPADLVHAVSVVERGESMLSPALTKRLLERNAYPNLGCMRGVLVRPALPEGGLRGRAACIARGSSAGLRGSPAA